ncbi:VOC family protein [Rhodopseudomonas palustris]|uniref:VOC family protein n=1 Tax=Rhodopseudomonas palustris TaxID=1076 RepID=UPI002ACEA9D8|nr:VOC family protein [Rhodopseudomonas palustris]WQG98070.1 VOC family protein [Rhodopseudomonas palustris]
MSLQYVIGIDHAVVMVGDLDAAAANWQRLGFTLSPRGTHSPALGSGNYTIMFGQDYIELLGILSPTEHNAPSRAFLAERGDGIERIAFTTTDAAKGADELRDLGLDAVGPIDFGRPVPLPGGGEGEARFSIFQWPLTEAPAGLRIFACQHHTRDTVWIPELQRHANGATGLVRVIVTAPRPESDARHLLRLIDGEQFSEPDGSVVVPSGSDRAEFAFVARDVLAQQYPGVSLDGVPERGGAGLIIAVADLAATEQAIGAAGVRIGDRLVVPPRAANGVLLVFVAR